MSKENKSYEYRNKNGVTFGITQANGDTMAYINGSYVAKAESDSELEAILDHFSHADFNVTRKYLGLEN